MSACVGHERIKLGGVATRRMACSSSAFLVLLCAGLLDAHRGESAREGPGPQVDTSSGRVAGLYTDTAQVFRSIPYARPPVGELRWKDPQRPFPVPGIISATQDPPGCPQLVPCDLPIPQFTCPKSVSEDCLYLNIFTPLNATSSSGLPVMLFIHGGNFLRGYSGGLLYDGQYIANTTSTIVVTINYRLGAMGFLVYGEGPDTPQGNYGLRDQRMAMQWVQENIENFGGDPEQVTIWGQSAGASSVSIHMASVRSAGLFSKAIMESNPLGISLKDMSHARKLGKVFAEELGCKDLACLQKTDITDIADAQEKCLAKIIDYRHFIEAFMQWSPVIDYVDLFDQPMNLMVKGQIASVPVLMGTTSEETVFYVYQVFTSSVSKVERDALELAVYPYAYPELRKFYPASPGDQRPDMSVITTDFTFTCTGRYALMGMVNLTQRGELNTPVWIYNFNHSISFNGWGKDFEYCEGHSCHSIELPFVFHSINLANFTPTADEMNLAKTMVEYWTNFARQGNPNNFGPSRTLMDWPPYFVDKTTGTKQSQCMRFKTPGNEVISDYNGVNCRFWDSVGYYI